MSGIEVAGLVLGAFPIAIWALEQYRDVARVMGFWYEIRSEYHRSSNELKFHHLNFHQNLKRLILPLVPDDAQLQLLISDPGGEGWKDPDIQKALEARLQDSYELYLDILGDLQRVMQELNKELAIDNDAVKAKVNGESRKKGNAGSRLRRTVDRSNRGYQVFRMKFSVGERIRTRLFGELQTYNDRLEKLMASSDIVSELETTRQDQPLNRSKAMSTAMSKFWNSADRLYRALLGAWSCNCRDYHCARLVLQHRTPADKDFRLHLEPGIEEWEKWHMCSVVLRTAEDAPRKSELGAMEETSAPVSLSTPQHHMQHKAALPGACKIRKKVNIAGPQSFALTQMSQTVTILAKEPTVIAQKQISVSLSGETLVQSPGDKNITDLCDVLGTKPSSAESASPLGFLSPNDSEIRFAIHLDGPDSPVRHYISLSQLLADGSRHSITRRQRYRLSLTLASSFVQIQDTAWLQTPWDKRNVYFYPVTANEPSRVGLDCPFIMSRFHQRSITTINDRNTPDNRAQHMKTSAGCDAAGIASLGILLLELCFGCAIEQHPNWLPLANEANEQVRAGLALVTALEWLKDVNDEAGADYTAAVEWCLAGCRTLPGDRSWRKLMVERVVEPLERCLGYLG